MSSEPILLEEVKSKQNTWKLVKPCIYNYFSTFVCSSHSFCHFLQMLYCNIFLNTFSTRFSYF